jgi:pyrrolidone-carboxylate peptidase
VYAALSVLIPALIAGPLFAAPALADTAPTGARCYDTSAPLTVEEKRLTATLRPDGPAVGPELVRLAGFDRLVDDFTTRLCAARTPRAAGRLVERSGVQLWETAVDRAQNRRPDLGTLDRYDDRPLYWARLEMSRALRQWKPRFGLDAAARGALLTSLDHGARGLNSTPVPPGSRARTIMVSGFDPFQLNGAGVRISNPAGVSALQLDGRTFDTPQGKVVVRAVSFPVVWGYFDRGIVEAAYAPALSSRRPPSMIMTISQGRPGRFDIERWAGNWRGGAPDNNDAGETGAVPPAAGWPQPPSQFIETSLPYQRMIDAGTGPYPVDLNREFCVWPSSSEPGVGQEVCRTDEPLPGEVAAQGGGGNYLSNESMYRSNRVRLGLGANGVRGGHLHTPVLGVPADPAALTDTAFENRRRAMADQAVALAEAAASEPGVA